MTASCRAWRWLSAVLLAAFVVGAQAAPRLGDTVTPFEAKLLDGKTARYADYAGKPLVLVFWAAWCPPCKPEMAALEQLHKRYRKQGLAILAISLDDDIDDIREFVRETPVGFPIALSNDSHYTIFGPMLFPPRMFLIDRRGRLVDSQWGSRTPAELDAAIRKLL